MLKLWWEAASILALPHSQSWRKITSFPPKRKDISEREKLLILIYSSSFILKKMGVALVDKEQERGGSFVNSSTRYAKIYHLCKDLTENYGNMWRILLLFWRRHVAAHEPGFTGSPRKKHAKAETFYFCSRYRNLVELKPSGVWQLAGPHSEQCSTAERSW